jgi:tRNA pseudouridine55 synthase
MNGFVIINKPTGLSSHQVVSRVRKFFKTRKVGHNGTLDPFASGLLVLSVGEFTKYIPYIPQSPKTYTATLKLGQYTDTWDNEGEISRVMPIPTLTTDMIIKAFHQVKSMTSQEIPAFSAKRHEGKRLYEYARNNEEIPTLYKDIQISALDLISHNETDIIFSASVSSGTFIRTIGQDIAKKLGTCGHLTQLTRTAIGHINLSDSQTLDECLSFTPIPLHHIPTHTLNDNEIERLCQGQYVNNQGTSPNLYRLYDETQKFIGLIEIDDQIIRAKRMNNTQII